MELQEKIQQRLSAALQKEERISDLVNLSQSETTGGLRPYEVAALAVIAAETLGPASAARGSEVGQGMAKAGFNQTASTLALRALMAQGLVATAEVDESDWNNSYTWTGYVLTDEGIMWLRNHESMLELHAVPEAEAPELNGEEIPF